MGITSSCRTAAGGLGLAALTCVATLALAGQAQAVTTSYPAGGSTFDGDAQGWVSAGETCEPAICTTTNAYDSAEGNPPGSLATSVNVTVNALQTFTGTGTWISPAFQVSAPDPVTGATFSLDRRLDDSGLVDLEPQSTIVVSLVDESAGTTIPLVTDELTTANSEFAPLIATLAPGGFVDGHSYRLRIATATTSSLAGVNGQADTRFDNVALAVTTAPGGAGTGDDDGGNSPGVTVVRGPYSDVEIGDIVNRFDLDADTGTGRDGSLIPMALCTIVGTSGPDRINGTAGNDVICGLGGDDEITGAGRRDAIDGADGHDRLSGGIGSDLLLGLRGLAGKDRINGGPGDDRLDGGAGNDVLRGFAGHDRLIGRGGHDRLFGGSGRDRFAGGAGVDRIDARDAARDIVKGGPGRDRAVADRRDRISSVAVIARR